MGAAMAAMFARSPESPRRAAPEVQLHRVGHPGTVDADPSKPGEHLDHPQFSMVGLGSATILTLVIVTVLYAIFFRIPDGKAAEEATA